MAAFELGVKQQTDEGIYGFHFWSVGVRQVCTVEYNTEDPTVVLLSIKSCTKLSRVMNGLWYGERYSTTTVWYGMVRYDMVWSEHMPLQHATVGNPPNYSTTL